MPPEATALSAPATDTRLPAAWRAPLAALAATVLALAAVTVSSWTAMFHQWWNIDTYNHLLLVPFIIAWLVAVKEEPLAALAPRPFAPGLIAVAAALGLWRAGTALDINLVAQVGAVGAMQASVLTMLGVRIALVLALPLAFAAFMVPFGDEIILHCNRSPPRSPLRSPTPAACPPGSMGFTSIRQPACSSLPRRVPG